MNVDKLIESMRTSENTLLGISAALEPYYKDIKMYDEKAIEKFIKDKFRLVELRTLLNDIDNWNQETIENVLKDFQIKNELSVPAVNQPIRISLVGSTKSPGLGLTLSIFDKNQALKRIDNLISHIG